MKEKSVDPERFLEAEGVEWETALRGLRQGEVSSVRFFGFEKYVAFFAKIKGGEAHGESKSTVSPRL